MDEMTKAKRSTTDTSSTEPDAKETPPTRLQMMKLSGETEQHMIARTELEPDVRHAVAAMNASGDVFGAARGGIGDYVTVGTEAGKKVLDGDLSILSRTMTAQALTLDGLFTQMLRKASANMGQYPDAMERYMRLGLKAQAQSRATIEALVSMHQPREQTVRHIHVGPNGQAVFVENLHGGLGNAESSDRPHRTGSRSPALLGHDAAGNGVSVSGDEGQEAVPHTRRGKGKRRATGE